MSPRRYSSTTGSWRARALPAAGGARGRGGSPPSWAPRDGARRVPCLPDRLLPGPMAAAVLPLLATAFLPIAGWHFAWVTPHWIAGLVLTLAIVFHIVRSLFWQDFRLMVVDGGDLRSGLAVMRRAWGG